MNAINPPTEEIKEAIKNDIKLIEDAIESNDEKTMKDTHFHIDGKYHTCIFDWGKSMYAHDPDYGFIPLNLSKDKLIHNLNVMKANLEGYALGLNSYIYPDNPDTKSKIDSGSPINIYNTNENTNTNNNYNNLSFDQARQQVENMTALSQEQTDEIIEKIDEIEVISKEKTPKKKKWEKIKPILAFALDKGVDIVIMLWSLALQHGFGQ